VRGHGAFELTDGRIWLFPAAAFSGSGSVGGRQVRCLSAQAQVQCHGQGYAVTEKDRRDMERLQERFGLVLPVSFCRQRGESVSPRGVAQQGDEADGAREG
jgi:lincosamide nucleotidyltransferase A/C/D/E